MSSNTNELKQRIVRIKQIRRTVNAMYLLSAVQLQKDLPKADYSLSYMKSIKTSMAIMLNAIRNYKNRFFYVDDSGSALYMSLLSEKGLCGGFNREVIALTAEMMKKKQEETGKKPVLYCFGQRGAKGFTRASLPPDRVFDATELKHSLKEAQALAEELITMYITDRINEVYVVYTPFSRGTPQPVCERLLPIMPEDFMSFLPGEDKTEDMVIEPDAHTLFEHMVPLFCAASMYQFLLQSRVEENMVRRQSLQSAIDSADKLVAELEIRLNEERRLSITNEIALNSAAQSDSK